MLALLLGGAYLGQAAFPVKPVIATENQVQGDENILVEETSETLEVTCLSPQDGIGQLTITFNDGMISDQVVFNQQVETHGGRTKVIVYKYAGRYVLHYHMNGDVVVVVVVKK